MTFGDYLQRSLARSRKNKVRGSPDLVAPWVAPVREMIVSDKVVRCDPFHRTRQPVALPVISKVVNILAVTKGIQVPDFFSV